MEGLAPIILFVYNRLEHTQQTVESLKRNTLAKESILYIFSDAAKDVSIISDVDRVREYIDTIYGFKDVRIIKRDLNFGLARSIIEGVTKVVGQYGKIIVLEDDLITSPYFLQYMNDSLDLYKNEKSVMSISAYMYPIDKGLPETFFTYFTSCWGWGTWKDEWELFERNPEQLLKTMNVKDIEKFNIEGADNIWRQVKLNVTGQIYTWAVFWYATVFKKGGLVLHPAISMTVNIGHDGSGVHCGDGLNYIPVLASKKIEYFEKDIRNNQVAVERIKRFLLDHKLSIWERVIGKVKKYWKNR